MESRKGGCLLVPRYSVAGAAAGVSGQAAPPGVSWQMGRIMLKFRPIAPKPAAMAPAPATVAAAAPGRGKRKAVAGGGGRRGRKPKKAAAEKSVSSRSSSSSAMTSVDSSPPSPPPPARQPPARGNAEDEQKAEAPAPVHVSARAAVTPSTTWVTVEDVTSTWRDGEAPSADGEAPAFVSDRWGRVSWSNAAFSHTVADGSSVALAGALPAWGTCAGFTCRVRVRHSSGHRSVVAPCDVWRLHADGCYLWRLDLQAALTLGTGLP